MGESEDEENDSETQAATEDDEETSELSHGDSAQIKNGDDFVKVYILRPAQGSAETWSNMGFAVVSDPGQDHHHLGSAWRRAWVDMRQHGGERARRRVLPARGRRDQRQVAAEHRAAAAGRLLPDPQQPRVRDRAVDQPPGPSQFLFPKDFIDFPPY